jgi:ferredoxin
MGDLVKVHIESDKCNKCCLCTLMFPKILRWEEDSIILTKQPESLTRREIDYLCMAADMCQSRALKMVWP